MGIKKKKSSIGAIVQKNTDEAIVLTPPWETKLKEQFAFSNNPGRWKDRQSVDEVIAFIKIELNEPIARYEKQLMYITLNKMRVAFKDAHGGGNWRRLYSLFEKELEYTLAVMTEKHH